MFKLLLLHPDMFLQSFLMDLWGNLQQFLALCFTDPLILLAKNKYACNIFRVIFHVHIPVYVIGKLNTSIIMVEHPDSRVVYPYMPVLQQQHGCF